MMLMPDFRLWLIWAVLAWLSACRQDMHDQARVDAYEENPLAPGHTSGFLPPAGAIAHGALQEGDPFFAKAPKGHLATSFPWPMTLEKLQRGRERFEIFCQPCHGATGRGDGPVAQRGFFPRIADLQEARLREVAVGHIFSVITNGFNMMPAYSHQIEAADRWAITAYVKALQYSQHARRSDVPADILSQWEREGKDGGL